MMRKLLNRWQTKWSEFISRFDFKITHISRKTAANPDVVTTRSSDIPCERDELLVEHQKAVLKLLNLHKNLNLTAN